MNTLSKLGTEASITLALELTLKGKVTNEHTVQMALKEIRGRGAVYKPSGPATQHFGDQFTITGFRGYQR